MMKAKVATLAAVALLAFCSEKTSSPDIRFPCEWPGSPGFGGKIDQANYVQPSGLCFHPRRKTLFVASDEGWVAEMKTDGTDLWSARVPGDLEAITVDPETGLLYVAIEAEDTILEFDPDRREVTRRFPINRSLGSDPQFLQRQVDRYDNGIEALAFVPDSHHPEGGSFFAGNQEDPPCIIEVLAPLKSSREAEAEAKIIRMRPLAIQDPSDMYYDGRTHRLNIVCDAPNVLLEITLQGKIIKQYAFPGDTQEGIACDEDGFIYIAQDVGGIIKLKDLRPASR
jgi:uncharacterized protein YjiK